MSPSRPETELRARDGHAEAQQQSATGLVAPVIFIAISLIGAYSLAYDPYLSFGASETDPGPAFVPWITVCVLGIGGVVALLIELLKARRSGGITRSYEFTASRLWLPTALVLLLFAYVPTIRNLGFFWPSAGFSLICIMILHWRTSDPFTRRYLVQFPIEAAIVTSIIYAIFRYGILVPLP